MKPDENMARQLLLATYGTLMRSFGRHEHLEIDSQLAFVGPCQWEGGLYDLGSYPGAVSGEGTVHGELFRLRDPEVWTVLDRYEGYDPNRGGQSLFVRRRTPLEKPSGHTAWIYWYNGDPSGHPQVPSGDWEAYLESEARS